MDPSTRLQWNAREEAGEILVYQQLWEELEVAFGFGQHDQMYRKQRVAKFAPPV